MKHIVILGSTGSIGVQSLALIDQDKDFKVEILAAGRNIELLEKQIYKYEPSFAYVHDKEAARLLKSRLKEKASCRVIDEMGELTELIKAGQYDMVLNAIVGMAGILPTLAAVESGRKTAIANKETLVCAGHILMSLAKKTGAKIIPVDSEHSAIAQCLAGESHSSIDHIIITASGGPFYNKQLDLSKVRVQEALAHPNWSMGAKISIDSATMVNKALEVMEAKWLFHLELENIKVLIHPKSIVHSMVCFKDGAIKAQLGVPDMKLPISYALYDYNRKSLGQRLDLAKIGQLQFYEVKKNQYSGFELGIQAAKIGGSMPTVFNAANEMAVSEFLNEKISFADIPSLIETAMDAHEVKNNPSIEEILGIEAELRSQLNRLIEKVK